MYIFPELRKHQLPTLEKIKSSKNKIIIIRQPPGGGKSFYPEQLAYEGEKVLTCVGIKSLQTQYAKNGYKVPLFGKGNYECLQQITMFGDTSTANDCELKNKQWCNENCPYPLAREKFLSSNGGVLNYPKFLLDKPLVDQFDPEYLFLDEAHLLSDTVLNYVGLEFKWSSKQLQKYSPGQPDIIDISHLPKPLANGQKLKNFLITIEWLKNLISNMWKTKLLPPQKGGNLYAYRWHKNKHRQAHQTLNFMSNYPDDWHIENNQDYFLIKPLTSRFNFINLFDKAKKIILMSATINKHDLRELGIKDYEWIDVPNLWPPPLRPVVDLKCPKMGYSSSMVDWNIHAKKIALALSKRPSEHTGIIHTPSKKLAHDLAFRLGKLSNRRFFVPDNNMDTEKAYNEWGKIKNDGTIFIGWQGWEGWDLAKDSICIVAKTPFVNFANSYDKARFMYDGKAGYSRVAAKFEQGLGRIRRGNLEDYGNNKFVAIADGNWVRVKKYFNDVLVM